MIPEVELAYAAGLFDGEGCIGSVCPPSNTTPIIYVSIGTTDLEILSWFEERFKGKTSPTRLDLKRKKPYAQWKLHGMSCKPFLTALLPYLRYKKPQALMALAALEDSSTRGVRVTEEQSERRWAIHAQLKDAKGA